MPIELNDKEAQIVRNVLLGTWVPEDLKEVVVCKMMDLPVKPEYEHIREALDDETDPHRFRGEPYTGPPFNGQVSKLLYQV